MDESSPIIQHTCLCCCKTKVPHRLVNLWQKNDVGNSQDGLPEDILITPLSTALADANAKDRSGFERTNERKCNSDPIAGIDVKCYRKG
jgi:hypothetical protein